MALAVERLARAGVRQSMVDVRRLACAATRRSAAELIASVDQPLQTGERLRFEAMVERRAAREPVSRITSRRGFWTLELIVTPAVLDPRPETETLVETALELARDMPRSAPLRLLDVGTGSGAVLLAMLSEMPSATGVGTDISPAALEVARANARRLGLAERAQFRLADGLDGVAGPFDLLVSNPPYIETATITGLDPEVACYDPHLALDGGMDGLEVYRKIAARLKAAVPDGWAAFEIGKGQEEKVLAILRDAVAPVGSFRSLRRQDLSGTTRVVAAKTQD
jgi:release factor glutamine methyltransferase